MPCDYCGRATHLRKDTCPDEVVAKLKPDFEKAAKLAKIDLSCEQYGLQLYTGHNLANEAKALAGDLKKVK